MTDLKAVRSAFVRDGLGLLAVLCVAGAVRWLAWTRTVVLFNDGPIFLELAQAIEAGRWAEVLAHPFHPLYPAAIALVAQTSVGWEVAAVLVSIVGGLLSVVAIYLFARRAFDPELAWLAAWTVALHPWAVDFSSDVMSDGLYAGLFLLGFAAMARLVEGPRWASAIACGLAAGLAYLVRPEGVGLLVACGLLLILRTRLAEKGRREGALAMMVVVLVSVLVMSPLLGSLFQQTGELRLTHKKSIAGLAGGVAHVEGGGGAQLQPDLRSGAVARPIALPRSSERVGGGGAERPLRSLAGLLEATSRVVRTSIAALRYEIALFAVVGLWALRSRWSPLREATVGLTALLYTGLLFLLVWGAGYVARRHALAALLPICAYAALGFRALYARAVAGASRDGTASAARLRRPAVVCGVLVLVLCVVWGDRNLRFRRPERAPVRLAAEWLRANASREAPVAAQKLRVAYYSGAPFVPLPSGADGRIEETLRQQGVGWVVIDDVDLEDHAGLAAGLNRWLIPIHTVRAAGHRALVLEVAPRPAS